MIHCRRQKNKLEILIAKLLSLEVTYQAMLHFSCLRDGEIRLIIFSYQRFNFAAGLQVFLILFIYPFIDIGNVLF